MLALKTRGPEMEDNSSPLDTRVTRLEVQMEHTGSNISKIMTELHDLRTSTEARFEAINQKFDQKFEAVNEKIDQKFGAVNEKIDQKFTAVNERFDRMNDRISMLHVTMNEKFGEINGKFGEINGKFSEIKVWALTVLGGGLGFGILAVVARAFHWI
jgi:DNA anti-recombination protein RmuC